MTFFGWGGVARVQWFAAFVAHSTKFLSRALPHQVIGMTTKNDLDNLDLMTNLYPRTTGLPMVIWVGPSYGAGHSARIKVMQRHGQQMDPGDLAVVALQPQPHVVAGRLAAADLQLVSQWLTLNHDAVLDHWNALIDEFELGQRLRKLPP